MEYNEDAPKQLEQAKKSMSEETYMAERKLLIDTEHSSARQHDKAILTLSAGGLALSISFVQYIAPSPLPGSYPLLGLSWLFFGFSITAILWSFLTSQSGCRRQRNLLDIEYSTGEAPTDQTNLMADITRYLNTASYVLFLIAVLLLAVFSWTNLPDPRSDGQMPGQHPAQNGPAEVAAKTF